MRWTCGYGHYEAETHHLSYMVTKQWRRGELMWFAYFQPKTEITPPKEVPGPMPMNRRQAMANCETHSKEHHDDE